MKCERCGQNHDGMSDWRDCVRAAFDRITELEQRLAAAEADRDTLNLALHEASERLLTAATMLADREQRLAAAEAERGENYRLWKEACRVKDIRHKAVKGGRDETA